MNAAPPVLVGDVGGTTTRFAIARGHVLEDVVTWPTAEERTLRAGIARYAADTGHDWGAAAVAVAGPVLGDHARLTNADWSSSVEEFGGPGRFLNDLEAAAWGLDALAEGDVHQVHGKKRNPEGAKVILGLGTGLGMAYRFDDAVIPGEGGHRRFAPDDDEQRALAAHIRATEGHEVVGEHVLSGSGLGRCLRFVRADADSQPIADLAALAREATQHPQNPGCRQAVELFARVCACEARGQALQVLASGGVWIVGGMAGRIPLRVWQEAFAGAFVDQGLHRTLLNRLPVFVVDQPYLGLLGAGVAAARL